MSYHLEKHSTNKRSRSNNIENWTLKQLRRKLIKEDHITFTAIQDLCNGGETVGEIAA